MNKIFLFILLLTSSLLSAQNFVGEKFKLSADSDNVVFLFEDGNSQGSYIGGVLTKSYLRLVISKKEFNTSFKSNIKKLNKKSEGIIVTENYILDKYDWDSSRTIFLTVGNKIGSIEKKEVKELLKLKWN
tara:strand:- start:72 stop:461 length:390 start_codon:yes stop_codon:yes gene_type:complete